MARMTRAEMQDPAYQEHIRKMRAEAGTEGRVRRAGAPAADSRAPGQPMPTRAPQGQPKPEPSIGAANPFVPRTISVEDMRVFAAQLESMVGKVSDGAGEKLRELAEKIESLEVLMAGLKRRTETLHAEMGDSDGGAVAGDTVACDEAEETASEEAV
jgi:hypothetical protein